MKDHPNPTVAAAVNARLQAKSRIKHTRLGRFSGIAQRNAGKLPVPLLYCGAHTQRYAGDEAINLQNLTTGDALRGSIIAPPGYKIVSADQGQIEARLNACLSDQDDLVQAFRDGEDVYSDMATDIYGVPVTEETEPKKRKVGKAIVLGAGYGMGGERCYDFLTGQWAIDGISREFSQQCINTYRTKYWRIKDHWRYVDGLLQVIASGGEVKHGPVIFRHGEIEMPSGMKMYYPDMMHDGENYRYRRYDRRSRKWNWVKIYGAMMVENLCQALARELLCDQMITLEKKWKSVHQIHDEIIFLVPESEVDLAVKVMRKVMEVAPTWMPELPLKVRPSAGNNLGECK
jgi:DNA polymerase